MTSGETGPFDADWDRDLGLEFAEVPAGKTAPRLNPGGVHVWYFSLSPPAKSLPGLRAHLNPQEVVRADRFFRAVHRKRFAAGRAILRQLLASYLGIEPEAVTFDYGPTGKPMLPGGEFRFNLSHSENIGVCAIARELAVGVDVEIQREKDEFLKIARRFFAEREYQQLSQLDDQHQLAGFYRCWTAKEALIKGWGLGLSAPLDQFAVQVAPDRTRLEWVNVAPFDAQPWSVTALPAPPGVTASLACEPAPGSIETGTLNHFPSFVV